MRRWIVFLCIGIIIFANLPRRENAVQAQDNGFREIQRLGDRGAAHSVAWSPDGSVAAIGGSDGVWLYRDNFEEEMQIQPAEIGGATWYVAWSPDGRFLAAIPRMRNPSDAVLRVWEAATDTIYFEESFAPYLGAGYQKRIFWSPDSRRIAMAGSEATSGDERNYVIAIWDVELGERIQQYDVDLPSVRIFDLLWNSDGTKLVSSIVGRVGEQSDTVDVTQFTIWDIEGNQPVSQYEYVHAVGEFPFRPLLQWSPDNHKLGVAIRADPARENTSIENVSRFGVLDAKSDGALQWDWSSESEAFVRSLIWSGDNYLVGDISESIEKRNSSPYWGQLLTVWNANDGEFVDQYIINGSVTWNNDSTLGMIDDYDYTTSTSTVEVIRIENGSVDPVFEDSIEDQGYFTEFDWTVGSRWVIGASARSISSGSRDEIYHIHIWDIETGEKISEFELPLFRTINQFASIRIERSRLFFSPDGETLVVAGATVIVWNMRTGTLIREIWDYMPPASSISWSPDGDRIASASAYAACVWIWEIENASVVNTICHDHWVDAVAWSPDGSMIATGMRPLFYKRETNAVSPYIFVWDVTTGELIDSFANTFDRRFSTVTPTVQVFHLEWASDSSKLLFAGFNSQALETSVAIWDRHTHAIRHLPIQKDWRNHFSLAWEADGTSVIGTVGGYPEAFFQWDVENNIVTETLAPECDCHFSLNTVYTTSVREIIGITFNDNYTEIWDILGTERIARLTWHVDPYQGISGRRFRWNPRDDTLLAVGSSIRLLSFSVYPIRILIWSIEENAENYSLEPIIVIERPSTNQGYYESFGSGEIGHTLEWSPDGLMIASDYGADNGGIMIWEIKSVDE